MTEDERITWLREQIEARRDLARVALADRGEWSVSRNDDFDYTVYPRRPATPGDAVADAWREDMACFIAANDPQQVIADCEMQLRLLGKVEAMDDAEYLLPDLASAYRHKLGHADHWGSGE